MYQIILFWNDTVRVSDSHSVYHQEFKSVHTAAGICQTYCRLLASGYELDTFDICMLLYVQS